jgi:hypothetical protein
MQVSVHMFTGSFTIHNVVLSLLTYTSLHHHPHHFCATHTSITQTGTVLNFAISAAVSVCMFTSRVRVTAHGWVLIVNFCSVKRAAKVGHGSRSLTSIRHITKERRRIVRWKWYHETKVPIFRATTISENGLGSLICTLSTSSSVTETNITTCSNINGNKAKRGQISAVVTKWWIPAGYVPLHWTTSNMDAHYGGRGNCSSLSCFIQVWNLLLYSRCRWDLRFSKPWSRTLLSYGIWRLVAT